ncbi:glycosyltransferase family 2 protein [Pseudomonas sp. LA5]|uniref:glycosyltransferase family 2 protein n=1 Tax=Pseudomonas sp. LA5 TaxID=3027850 RepID=UPI0023620941|nr:glycosyltransferase [Pseudomonas sp. LA5]
MSSASLMEDYQALREAGCLETAAERLALALRISDQRPAALVSEGLEALQQGRLEDAFLALAEAATRLGPQGEVWALLGHVLLAKGEHQTAFDLLSAPANPARTTAAVRLLRLRALIALPGFRNEQLAAELPYAGSAAELGLLLAHLPPGCWGQVEFDPLRREIHGWALDTRHLRQSPRLTLTLEGQAPSLLLARQSCPLLAEAGNAGAHGGFRLQLTEDVASLRLQWPDGQDLSGSPLATGVLSVPTPAISSGQAPDPVVDVLIPVYEGRTAALACIESVLRSRAANRTPMQLVVLDDASRDAHLIQALEALAAAGDIELHRRPVNLGFIRNMNRGMTLHGRRDVVWLNADTLVAGAWLDLLRGTVQERPDAATATPFSNNGELLSFPAPCEGHPLPTADELEALNTQAAASDEPAPEVEVGCGFCLYIRRSALDDVGLLDELHLQRGYGEETDWCLRARERGWRHLAAHRVFVGHQGGVSFGQEKLARVAFNNALLRERYPAADRAFERYRRQDPLRSYRDRLQRARLVLLGPRIATAGIVAQVASASHFARQALAGGEPPACTLAHRQHDGQLLIELRLHGYGLPLLLDYRLPAQADLLLEDLGQLAPARLRYLQAADCPDALRALPLQLNIPYEVQGSDDFASPLLESAALFLQRARALVTPYAALTTSLQLRCPAVPVIQLAAPRAEPASPRTELGNVLIGDLLQAPGLAQRWLMVLRRCRQRGLKCRFLLGDSSPWTTTLLAIGNVRMLPEVPGIAPQRLPALAGCTLVLSLEQAPTTTWWAPERARTAGLVLHAPADRVAHEAGAQRLSALPPALAAVLNEVFPLGFLHE